MSDLLLSDGGCAGVWQERATIREKCVAIARLILSRLTLISSAWFASPTGQNVSLWPDRQAVVSFSHLWTVKPTRSIFRTGRHVTQLIGDAQLALHNCNLILQTGFGSRLSLSLAQPPSGGVAGVLLRERCAQFRLKIDAMALTFLSKLLSSITRFCRLVDNLIGQLRLHCPSFLEA